MKNFKKSILLTAVYLLCLNCAFSQNKLGGNIEITPFIGATVQDIPLEAQNILINRLGAILTQNGVISGVSSKFVLTANTIVVGQEVTSSAPPMFVYSFEVSFYVGNGIDGKLFSSASISLNGIGTTKAKAYIDAFKNINPKKTELTALLTNAKAKIVDYYNANCSAILSEVALLEKTNRYNEALYKLTAIPEGTSCHAQSLSKAEAIFKKAIDFDCKTNLAKATQVWNASPNSEGAIEAANILKDINPTSACYADVKKLGLLISKKMNANDAREWDLYFNKEVGLEKDRINAIKEIGKAYGQGQPKNVTYNTKYWW